MMNKLNEEGVRRRDMVAGVLLFLLAVSVLLAPLSWLGSAMGLPFRNLFSAEGIRWYYLHVQDAFHSPLWAVSIPLLLMAGAVERSGLAETVRDIVRHGVSVLTYRQRKAFWLALAWLFLPLESKPFTAYRATFQGFYPQINPHAPKTLDCVRWLFQTLFLICFRTSARKGWLRLSISWAVNKIAAALTRLGDWVGHYGALALDGNHKSFETIDKKGEALSRPIKLTLLWILGGLAAALAVLCITQPFNIQGQVVFLSVMLLSALALRKIKARLTLMLLFVISMVVSGRYLWWRCTSTLNTDSAMGIFLSCLLLAAELYAFVVMVLGYFQVCQFFVS